MENIRYLRYIKISKKKFFSACFCLLKSILQKINKIMTFSTGHNSFKYYSILLKFCMCMFWGPMKFFCSLWYIEISKLSFFSIWLNFFVAAILKKTHFGGSDFGKLFFCSKAWQKLAIRAKKPFVAICPGSNHKCPRLRTNDTNQSVRWMSCWYLPKN